MENSKKDFLEKIQKNILLYGFHITTVFGGAEPRFAYTIGLNENLGFELIFAGAVFYTKGQVTYIINDIVKQMKKSERNNDFVLNLLGSFTVTKIHESWSKLMMLGFFDYYSINEVEVLQIIPDSKHFTLDIPNMSIKYETSFQPVWKWLSENWPYSISGNTMVITDLRALRGIKITEISRWEEDHWEAFTESVSNIGKESARIVSIATLFGIDPTLHPMLKLEINQGIWRDSDESDWHEWN